MADLLPAGRVGRPHGLDGSFRVVQPRSRLLVEGMPVRVADRRTEVVRRIGPDPEPVVRLAIAGDREGAEALRGALLEVPRDAAPALEEGEHWAEDFPGLRVVDGARAVGTVRRLVELPSCEVLEVERPGDEDLLVPLVGDAVRRLDVAGGVVDVDLGFLGEG